MAVGPPLYPKKNCRAPAPSWGGSFTQNWEGGALGGWVDLPCCPKAPVSPWQDARSCRCPRTWSGCHQVGARTCTKAPMGPAVDPLHFFLNETELLKCFMIPNMQSSPPGWGPNTKERKCRQLWPRPEAARCILLTNGSCKPTTSRHFWGQVLYKPWSKDLGSMGRRAPFLWWSKRAA